jgi:2,4-dienoyl-CoA reductase-like NADH-dependent reductase (Old Yellow Enzyme family)/thioredoxin reductase
MENYPNLFKPIRIGNMMVPNRVVHVPTDISSSHADGSVSDRDIHHHAEIAKGGVGLIVVGATTPDAKTGRPTVTCLVADGDNYIPGLKRLADSMHKYGAKCVVQLQHPGRQCAIPRYNTMSTNDMVLKLPWSAGHEIVYENAAEKGKPVRAMTTQEVLDMIELFSEAAWRVQQAGFDGVELHAAHGYLISQFMSPYLNRRIDRFGGNYENRMRFPLAIIDQIQKKCGREFPILVRYSVDEWVPGGRELEESTQVAVTFEQAGVAALDLSQCIQESPGAGFDPMYYPEGWTMYASEAIKKVVSIPVINSHTLRDPKYCDSLIADDKTDMVGLSRQMLADPYWAVKAKMGKDKEIRKCISCLTGCWQESMMAKTEIACAINPACYDEAFSNMKKTDQPRNIAVVGGGPAGMEAARILTVRGHKATLFERSRELGGAILGCCMAPGKEKMKWYTDWIRYQIKSLNVDVRLSCSPTVDDLKSYDLVLNATGASAYVPQVIGEEKVTLFEDVIACPKVSCEHHPGERKNQRVGERVVIWGDHYQAADTATFLASIGKDVTIVTENREFASSVEVIHMYVLRKRFNQTDAEGLHSKPFKHRVKLVENTTVYAVSDGEVTLQDKDFNRKVIKADTVISCHVRPNIALFDALIEKGIRAINVGDSVSVRNLHAAVREGATFGLNIDDEMLFNSNNVMMTDIPIDVLGQLK